MLQRLSSPQQAHYGRVQFTYWLQWHLHRQLRGVSLYAQQHRVALKGDLPIGEPKLPASLQERLPCITAL
jgi:4-alpha-glucanotransferase